MPFPVLKPGIVLLLVQILVLLWLLLGLIDDGFILPTKLQEQIHEQYEDNLVLSQRNARISAQVTALRENNLVVIEERARKDLGMIRKDETFFILVD